MALSSSGSSTSTIWNRRSKALSSSKYFWYSSRVVAPMARNSPRASAGFRMLAASIAPWPPPAPTRVWISSMNSSTSPSAAVTSLMTAFKRSSNSPLNLAPAISAPMSKAKSCLFFKFSGTSPSTMRWAKPSAMAVFPVPGSPTKMGLFFVRRLRIWSTRRISSSRPITGSNLFSCANWFRFLAYCARALNCFSAVGLVIFSPFCMVSIVFSSFFGVKPASFNIWLIVLLALTNAHSKWKVATYWSPRLWA